MTRKKDIYLTAEGFIELETELNVLRNEKRPEVINALKEARALGDLSENADYDAARNDQAMVEGRIKELETMISNAVLIEKNTSNKVGMGSCVEIKYVLGGEIEKYTIVGSQEADPFENKISNESKIAEAIMGKKKGDKATVIAPNGEYDIIIENIC